MGNRSATVAVWGRVVHFYGLSLISIVSLFLLRLLYAICGIVHCAKLLPRLVLTTQSSSVCFFYVLNKSFIAHINRFMGFTDPY